MPSGARKVLDRGIAEIEKDGGDPGGPYAAGTVGNDTGVGDYIALSEQPADGVWGLKRAISGEERLEVEVFGARDVTASGFAEGGGAPIFSTRASIQEPDALGCVHLFEGLAVDGPIVAPIDSKVANFSHRTFGRDRHALSL